MNEQAELFKTMHSMRAMRRLKPDPVPTDVIEQILDAGIRAPSGQNTQPWAFLVVTDDAGKQFFASRYHQAMVDRLGDRLLSADATTAAGRRLMAARHLAEHMHETPVILMVMGKRDWPFAVAESDRVGVAPPSYGSVYPCVQNILLAARALGLGASLTTMHQMFENELHDFYRIPTDYGVVATIPIGYPKGNFGPVTREPVSAKTHYGRWGKQRGE